MVRLGVWVLCFEDCRVCIAEVKSARANSLEPHILTPVITVRKNIRRTVLMNWQTNFNRCKRYLCELLRRWRVRRMRSIFIFDAHIQESYTLSLVIESNICMASCLCEVFTLWSTKLFCLGVCHINAVIDKSETKYEVAYFDKCHHFEQSRPTRMTSWAVLCYEGTPQDVPLVII